MGADSFVMEIQKGAVSCDAEAADVSTNHRYTRSVLILHGREKTQAEVSAAKLIEFMGGEARFAQMPDNWADLNALVDRPPQPTAIVVHAETLGEALPLEGSSAERLDPLTSIAARFFVFGFSPTRASEHLLHDLTGGEFHSVESLNSVTGRFTVAPDRTDICRQLAGLTFDTRLRKADTVFTTRNGQGICEVLIHLDGRPFTLWLKKGRAQLMLTSSEEIADLDDSPQGRTPMPTFFSRLAPLLLFLREVGGDFMWHGESPRACLIIDDPLLRPRYGFLEFGKLLAAMQREGFSTSIAFIPWNHRRSDARVTDLFRRFPSHLSLCIHGCDHTGAEFASGGYGFLHSQAVRGLQWMRRHRELTGVEFDEVMVFPQGHFSTTAIDALRSSGYLAAVNSTGQPTDRGPECLSLRDVLDVAVTRFSNFPLFIRHYPDDIVGLAVDLLLGKPALLVEHHGYFKNGYEPIENLVRALSRMEPRLKWTNLGTICSQACLVRTSESGEVLVRPYADRFQISNETNDSRCYVLCMDRTSPTPPVSVEVEIEARKQRSGGDSPGTYVTQIDLAPRQSAKVTIHRVEHHDERVFRPGFAWRAGVLVRRHLSELRDNYVDRNSFLRRVTLQLRNRLVNQ